MSTTTLSVLGVIVGACATLGGLIVVFLSVITLFQIRKQVDSRFQEKYQAHQETLNQQSAQWATGIRYWTQATMTSDLDNASQLMERALTAWPSAPGAKTEMLRRFCDETERGYIIDLIPGQRQTLINVSYSSGRGRYAMPWTAAPLEQHLDDCLVWLTRALEHELHSNEPWLFFAAAKIHAMRQNSDKMLEYLDQWLALTLDPPSDNEIVILLSAIHHEKDLQRLQSLWSQKFPNSLVFTLQDILQRLNSNSGSHIQYWLALSKSSLPHTVVVGFSGSNESQWRLSPDLTNRPLDVESLPNDQTLLSYIESRWILLRPIPWVQ